MKTVRVWFNHWFSTAYHIIKLLKKDDYYNFVVVGSNTDGNCVYRAVCDEWIAEEKFSDCDEYVDFCLDFCKKNKIDVFAVRRNMLAVSGREREFLEIGVKVLVEKYQLMKVFSDKCQTYKLFSDNNIGYIPQYYIAQSVSEFEDYYKRIKTDANRVCFKFVSDEGAVSFRVIDNKIEYNLSESIGAKITYADAVKSLDRFGKLPPLMVMPYLGGTEVSVDCFRMTKDEHIIVPRYKSGRRSEIIKFDPEIISICENFLNVVDVQLPVNLQFKYDGDAPYLLEVNARMSGGIQFACAATGVNIPNLAINRLLGVDKRAEFEKRTTTVSFIESPVIMEELNEC